MRREHTAAARTRIRPSLAAAAAWTALLVPGVTHAQSAPPVTPEEEAGSVVETVVVGRRDTPVDATSTSPVTVISADSLERSGAATIDDYFPRIPAISFQGVNGAQNNGGYGAVFADLRNLNFNRTVTLVNGRRFVLSGITTDEAVDLNTIPVSLIDHVEVLRDGSEPEYGADSVAGVINIVLRHDFTGLRATATAGVSTRGDAATRDLSLTVGRQFGPAHLTLDVSHSERDPLLQSRRGFARNPIVDAAIAPDGSLLIERGSSATVGGHAVTESGVDDLVTAPDESRPFDPATDGYDFAESQYLLAGQNRTTVTFLGDVDLGEHLTAFTEVLYARRLSRTLLPPQSLGLAGTARYPEGFVIPAGNPFNFYDEDVTLQRVLAEVRSLDTRTRAETFRVVAGLQGDLFGAEWKLSYNHGQVRQRFATRNAVDLTRVLNSVSDDAAACDLGEGCVPADYFGPGSLSPAAADYIRYTAIGRSAYDQDVISGEIERPFLTLPAGQWKVTIGAEHDVERGRVTPDAVTLAGDQAGSDAAPTNGRIVSDAAYLDLDLPILPQTGAIGAVRADLGARYSRYSYFGHFPTYRAALSWQPVGDLRLRATIGAARRVPALTEAFGGSTSSFLAVDDPCDSASGETDNPVVAANCAAAGAGSGFSQASPLIAVANGGSTALRPERSHNFTAGAILTPRFAPGLTVIADYYRIRIRDAIDSLADTNPDFIPDQCYETPDGTSPFCGLITRTPSGPSAGQISRIFAPDANLGEIFTDGMDIGVTYHRQVGRVALSLDWQNALLFNYLIRETPGSEQEQYAGTFPGLNFVGSYPRWRSVVTVGGDIDRFHLEYIGRYIGGADVLDEDPAETPFTHARAIYYQDVEASIRFEQGLQIAVGVTNLTDRRPPTLVDGATNTDVAVYDTIGRTLFIRATIAR